MKSHTEHKCALVLLWLALLAMPGGVIRAAPIGTGFTYQGRLSEGGRIANGSYDFEFKLYDSTSGGSQVGGGVTKDAVPVSDGLFLVELDFGAVFTGHARWLGIAVRTNNSGGTFTLLQSRQQLSPTPYALFSAKAGGLAENASQTFTGPIDFSPPSGPPFAVGSVVKVSDLNVDLLDGLDSSAFALKLDLCLRTVAELKARAGGFVPCVLVLGYHSPGDGGGGKFYWDASSSEPDNRGTTISPATGPATGRWKRLYHGPISVKWFGTRFGPVTQSVRLANKVAFRYAATNAIEAGGCLYVPPGRLEMELDPTQDLIPDPVSGVANTAIGVFLHGDLEIVGAGKDSTTIAWGPEVQAFSYYCFYLDSYTAPHRFAIRDLTIAGSSTPVADPLMTRAAAFKHSGSAVSNAPQDFLRFENVRVVGRWNVALESSDGNTQGEMAGSEMTGYVDAVGYFGGTMKNKRLRAYNCRFADATWAAPGHAADLLYIHPSIHLDIAHCRFENTARFAIYINDSGGIPDDLAPSHVQISGCVFENSCRRGIQSNRLRSTKVTACIFANNPDGNILLLNDAEIIGCSFGRIALNAGTGSIGRKYIVSGCKFTADLLPYTTGLINIGVPGGSAWTINSCDFHSAAGNAYGIATTSDALVRISDCHFSGDFVAAINPGPGASVIARGNVVEGAAGGIYVGNGIRGIELHGNEFLSTNRPCINSSSSADGFIRGTDNYFANDDFRLEVLGHHQYLELRRRLAPSPLASTANLDISFNFDAYHVTGSSLIENIFLEGDVVGDNRRTKLMSGTLKLVADGAWRLADTGNIRPKTTAARSPDEVVMLFHDPQRDIWYEGK